MGTGMFRLLSRIAAIWITTLILLPFTAPFSTCDLHDHSSHTSDTLAKDDVKADVDLAIAPSQTSDLTLPSSTPHRQTQAPRQVTCRRLLRPVLRL